MSLETFEDCVARSGLEDEVALDLLAKEELAVVAKDLGLDIRPGEMVAIFDLLDADKNGKISFDEFKAWWSGQKEVDHAWV